MLQKFKTHIESIIPDAENKKFLLAISGGLDSVVMLDLFKNCGFVVSVAHCNFGLRNEESDGDELFVKNLCYQNNIPFFSKRFETAGYAQNMGISIQMAARELRYEWFDSLKNEEDMDYVATAHHLNDQAETILINMLRGTGIAGLCGIAPLNKFLVRPLLFAERAELESFAKASNLKWREDASNHEEKYLRNSIRHHVIPALHKIQPDFLQKFDFLAHNNRQTLSFIENKLEEDWHSICIKSDSGLPIIKLSEIKNYPNQDYILYHKLKDLDFTLSVVYDIVKWLRNPVSGKIFHSPTHAIYADRDTLITTVATKHKESLSVNSLPFEGTFGDKKIRISVIEKTDSFQFHKKIEFIDFKLVELPITIRNWKKGDSLQPLGMQFKKKVSDIFIDKKIPIPYKLSCPVVSSNNEIICIPGIVVSERHKIQPGTKKVLKIEYE